MCQVVWPTSVELDAEDELLIFTFKETLPLGEAILGMEFEGTLNDQMRGFYRRYAWNLILCFRELLICKTIHTFPVMYIGA